MKAWLKGVLITIGITLIFFLVFLLFVVFGQETRICNKMEGYEQRCVTTFENVGSLRCEPFAGEQRCMAKVWRKMAVLEEDISICDEIGTLTQLSAYQFSEAGCMKDVAEKLGDITLCEKIKQINPVDELTKINLDTAYENCLNQISGI